MVDWQQFPYRAAGNIFLNFSTKTKENFPTQKLMNAEENQKRVDKDTQVLPTGKPGRIHTRPV